MNASDQAAEWFIAQRTGELTAAERERFMQWLGDSAANVREYLAVAELWGELPAAPSVRLAETPALIHALQGRAPVERLPGAAEKRLQSSEESKGKKGAGRRVVFAAAACLFLALGGVVLFFLQPNSTELTTQRGEQRTVELPDGSVMQVNALSRVVIDYDQRMRRIELREGEALFRVAKEATRPFEVATPGAVVRVLGTTFNVQHRGADTLVAVVEGKVQVRSTMEVSAPLPLSANESAHVAQGVRVMEAAAIEPRKITAWTQRRLIFDEEPLSRVVAEFNLYNEAQLSVDDAQLAQFHINGVFDADDPSALVAYLERVRGVGVERKNNGIRLHGTTPH